MHPLSTYHHTPIPLTVDQSVLHTLNIIHFRKPSEVHSALTFPAAISPPATLCMKRGNAYSLFVNGLSIKLVSLYHHFYLLSRGESKRYVPVDSAAVIYKIQEFLLVLVIESYALKAVDNVIHVGITLVGGIGSYQSELCYRTLEDEIIRG